METGKAELYFMDYLASMIKAPYAAQGYGGFFTTSIMGRHYKADMTRQQTYALMIECVKEVEHRLPNFAVVIMDEDGIHKMDTINPEVMAKAAYSKLLICL